jgi:tetratricopeptide (TPR) repeat protein
MKEVHSKPIEPATLFKEGLEFYRKALFKQALTRWRVLRNLDPDFENIALYINICERHELNQLAELEALDELAPSPLQGQECALLDSVSEAIQEFKGYQEAGKMADAAQVLSQLKEERPHDFEAQVCLVRGYKKLGDFAKMEESAKELAKTHPYVSSSHCLLGRVFMQLERFDEARSAFIRARRLQPKDFRILCLLGTASASLNEPHEARTYYQEALALKPDHRGVKKLIKRLGEDAKELDSRILEVYEKLGQEKPFPDIFCRLAKLYRCSGQLEEAFSQIKKALAINPHYKDALYEKGKLEIELSQYQEALATFYKILHLSESSPSGIQNVLEFERAGYFQEAACELLRQLKIEPDYGAVHVDLGKEYFKNSNLEAAEMELRKGLYLSPHYADGHYYLALCLRRKGEMQTALDHLDQALELNPFYADATMISVGILVDQNRVEAAKRLLQRFMSCSDPQSPEFRVAKQRLESLK